MAGVMPSSRATPISFRNPKESVGEIDLRASVRSLRLCGECFLE